MGDPRAATWMQQADGQHVDLAADKNKKPKLLLMGLKRSGKTSISNVVFRKMQPSETLYLPTTTAIQREATHTFMDFQIWDLPGQMNYLDPNFDADSVFGGVGAMVWVLDAVDDYTEPIDSLTKTVLHLRDSYPDIKYVVFIHKVDSLSDDLREDVVQDITSRIADDLSDNDYINPAISYHSTSIYDSSIYEGFSKVMQSLLHQLPIFETALDQTREACRFEKVFLFDVWSKVYIASDTSPDDRRSYDVCAAFIDMIVDSSEIFGYDRGESQGTAFEAIGLEKEKDAEAYVSAFGDFTMVLQEVDRSISFIGVSRQADFHLEKALIEHNLSALKAVLLNAMKD